MRKMFHAEMFPAEMSLAEMSPAEMSPAEMSHAEMSPAEMSLAEMSPAEMFPLTVNENLIKPLQKICPSTTKWLSKVVSLVKIRLPFIVFVSMSIIVFYLLV